MTQRFDLMPTNPFDPYINTMPALRGRNSNLDEILSMLAGTNHVSVVAPKFYGKRALLRQAAERARAGGDFASVIEWDMKATPTSAETFFKDMAQQVWDQWPMAGDYFSKAPAEMTGENFIAACEDWDLDGHRILIVWASFDDVLRNPELPENFLGQLVNLCGSSGIRVLASTRHEMPELVVNQADIGSKLWGRFVVHLLRTLGQTELSAIGAEWESNGRSFAPGAETALSEITGNAPPLVFALLGKLWNTSLPGVAATKADVQSAAEDLDTRILKEIWKELSADSQRLMQKVARTKDGMPTEGIPDRIFEPLSKRHGLLRKATGRFMSTSKLFAEFASRQEGGSGQIAILFGTTDGYAPNMAEVLRQRLGQVRLSMSQELRRSVETMLDNMEDCSAVALDTVRRAFLGSATLLMKRQFPTDRIPQEMITRWKTSLKWVPECAKDGRVPRLRGHMIQLLRKLHENLELKPQQALPLFELLYEAGNLAQHDDEHEPVSGPFAVAVATAAVELLVLLDQTK